VIFAAEIFGAQNLLFLLEFSKILWKIFQLNFTAASQRLELFFS